MFDLGEATNRISNTFSALPSYGPGQFNVGGLGPIGFNMQAPGPAFRPQSQLGPIQFGTPGFGLGPINFNLGGTVAPFQGLQLNGNGTTYKAPPPLPTNNNQNSANTNPSSPYSTADASAYIRNKAATLHIDPEIALTVAQNEGLNNYVGDQGSSFGPFQLHYGNLAGGGNSVSGLGDTFTAQTGLKANDSSTWKQQVDWVLNGLSNGQFDWSPFHGAAAAGITGKQGIGTYNGPVPEYLNSTAPKTPLEQTAESQLASITGLPYHWGGHDPTTGFDCSGFVSWVYGQQGVKLTPQTQAMFGETAPVAGQPQPGDLVFFNMNTSDPHLQHVGIYIGNGQFINDTDYAGKSGVQISNLSDWQSQNPQFRSVHAQ